MEQYVRRAGAAGDGVRSRGGFCDRRGGRAGAERHDSGGRARRSGGDAQLPPGSARLPRPGGAAGRGRVGGDDGKLRFPGPAAGAAVGAGEYRCLWGRSRARVSVWPERGEHLRDGPHNRPCVRGPVLEDRRHEHLRFGLLHHGEESVNGPGGRGAHAVCGAIGAGPNGLPPGPGRPGAHPVDRRVRIRNQCGRGGAPRAAHGGVPRGPGPARALYDR
mmetsp:Transcript_11947/g.33636  ORF Transcript_11947/g.33636 Transcript_11947/m.33636 type:complete len:218 (-) Transcript_11947:871-1524(-)